MDWNDMAWAVYNRQSSIHQFIPQELHITLVSLSQLASFFTLEHPYGSQGPIQNGGRQGGGEDETYSIAT